MSPYRPARTKLTHPSVLELLQSSGIAGSPEEVIRLLARRRVAEFEELGWTGPPYDMELLASLCDYRPRIVDWLRDDQDACITTGEMLINANKPAVRQRFSIGHEIGHTLFPDFVRTVELNGPRWRRQLDAQSQVEQLCQIAASEFLMPYGAFQAEMNVRSVSLRSILELAELFNASPEATARRFVDLSTGKLVAAFATMKWKPTELVSLQQPALDLVGFDAPPMKMRMTYAAASPSCGALFLPPDKSLPDNSVAYHVWRQTSGTGGGSQVLQVEEDWSSVGRLGVCYVEAVTLPLNSDVPQSVLCLLHLAS
jgi:hypothetical protein